MLPLKNLKVVEITDSADKIRESLVNNYVEWGKPLSVDDYLERERQLHEIHVRHGFDHRTFAVLNEGDEVIAACEVLTRPLYRGMRHFSKDHGIATVFVRQEYRRMGVGNLLISEMTKSFDNKDERLSLWSDVGDYYSRFGFKFPPAFQGEPLWNRSIICTTSSRCQVEHSCEMLDQAQTNAQIVPEHYRLLIRDTDSILQGSHGKIDVSVIVPHVGSYENLQFRATYSAEKLGLQVPTKFSARTSDGHGWISWTFFFASKQLLVLGIYGSANEMALLLCAAAQEAEAFGCYVELYESSIVEPLTNTTELVAAVQALDLDVYLKERTKALPMSTGSTAWIFSGGYAWY